MSNDNEELYEHEPIDDALEADRRLARLDRKTKRVTDRLDRIQAEIERAEKEIEENRSPDS